MKTRGFFTFLLILLAGIIIMFDCINKKTDQETESVSESDTIKTVDMKQDILTNQEKVDGWQLLFNGQTTDGWRGFNEDSIGEGWVVQEGCLVSLGKGGDIGGDIITVEQYSNFELKMEWKLSPGGNSGILYRVNEGDYPAVYATGPEYQLVDDLGFPEKLEDWQTTGANYAMHPPQNAKIMPIGEWNTSRIVVNEDHVEHWLNGVKVVEYTLWDENWNTRVASGKWKDYPDYGKAKTGHISLQDHGSMIWFRNIKIRTLQ